MLHKSLSNSKAQNFMLQKFYVFYVQKYISHRQKNVLIVFVPILINKDVVKPSYKDLKFMVRNCNYVCTNLINFGLVKM